MTNTYSEIEVLKRQLTRERKARELSESIANQQINRLCADKPLQNAKKSLKNKEKKNDFVSFFSVLLGESGWSVIAIELTECSKETTQQVLEIISNISHTFADPQNTLIIQPRRWEIFVGIQSTSDAELAVITETIRSTILYRRSLSQPVSASITYVTNISGKEYGSLVQQLVGNLDTAVKMGSNVVIRGTKTANKLPLIRNRPNKIFPVDIYHKLLDGSYHYVFQPIFNVCSGRVVNYEALLRPKFEIEQKDFIEGVQCILVSVEKQKTKQMLLGSLMDSMALMDQKCLIPVSINCDVFELIDDVIFEEIFQFCLNLKTKGQPVSVEILEGSWGPEVDLQVLVENLQVLRNVGVKISLDDFGASESNFFRLMTLNIDYLKLDRSITQVSSEDDKIKKIVRSTFHLCRDLNIGIIAEGVETGAQSNALKQIGIVHQQGFYFS